MSQQVDTLFTGGTVLLPGESGASGAGVAVTAGRISAIGPDDELADAGRAGHRGRRPGRRPAAARASRTPTSTRSMGGARAAAVRPARRPRPPRSASTSSPRTPRRNPIVEWISAAAGRWRSSRAARRLRQMLDAVVARPPGVPDRTATATAPGSTPGRSSSPGSTRRHPTRPTAGSSATPTAPRPARLHEGAMDARRRGCCRRQRPTTTVRRACWPRRTTCSRSASPPGRTRSSATLRHSTTRTPIYVRGGRSRRPEGAGGRCAVVGARRAVPSRSPSWSLVAPRRPRRAGFARDQREDHAGRRRRELHRRDARRPTATHERLRDTTTGHRRSSTRSRCATHVTAARRRRLPGALPRARRPRRARGARRRRGGPRGERPHRRPAPPGPPPGGPPRRHPAVRRARRGRQHPAALGRARAADGRAHAAVPR